MAILPASTTEQIGVQLTAAVAGDFVDIAPGTYGLTTLATGVNKTGMVTVRPQDRDNPPNFPNRAFALTGARYITFDGLACIGTAVESTSSSGVQHPLTDKAFHFIDCNNIRLTNNTIRFYRDYIVRWEKVGSAIPGDYEIDHNDFEQMGNDTLFFKDGGHDIWVHHNVWRDDRINKQIVLQEGRHADAGQSRCNPPSGSPRFTNFVWEDNYIEMSGTGGGAGTSGGKGIYMTIDSSGPGVAYEGTIIRRCKIICGRGHGIFFCGHNPFLVESTVLRKNPGTVSNELPTISIWNASNRGEVKNVVAPRGLMYGGPAGGPNGQPSHVTFTNFTVSDTAVPTGYVELVPGVNCGAYTGGGTTPATPPLMTVPEDVYLDSVVEVPEFPGYHTAVLRIPTTSRAHATATLNINNVSWLPPGQTAARGFRAANPAQAIGGGLRLELIGGGIRDLYTVPPGSTISGIQLGYKVNGVFSGWSGLTETISFTAPSVKPDPLPLAALTTTQWAMFGSVREVDGLWHRFTQDVHLNSTAPVHNGAQWTRDGETSWRPCVSQGSDGAGGTRYSLAPSQEGAQDHTVTHNESLSIRLRYSVNAEFGPQSASAKGFTGPPPPPPIVGYEPGKSLAYIGDTVSVAGVIFTIPYPTQPPPIQAEDIIVDRVVDTVTVTLPSEPPLGAAGQHVIYAGRYHEVENGVATFEAVEGQTFCLATAHDGGDPPQYGPCLYIFLPEG